jgi:predicted metalloprotease with PDZ domain
VLPGSPAETAGLDRDDVILAVDSHAVGPAGFDGPLSAHKPGDQIRVTVLRLAEIKEIPVTIGSDPHPAYTLKPMEHPTSQQKAIYNSWLGIK